jgi:hypothetical protein
MGVEFTSFLFIQTHTLSNILRFLIHVLIRLAVSGKSAVKADERILEVLQHRQREPLA